MNSYSSGVAVLNKCRPYLRLLEAFNYKNRQLTNWQQFKNYAFSVLCTSIILHMLLVIIMLGFWYLVEIKADLRTAIGSLPLLFSLVQVEVAFIVMMINNEVISESIEHVQKVINQRKLCIQCCHKKPHFCSVCHRTPHFCWILVTKRRISAGLLSQNAAFLLDVCHKNRIFASFRHKKSHFC